MYGDEAGMSRGCSAKLSSFFEDTGKADMDHMVCYSSIILILEKIISVWNLDSFGLNSAVIAER